MAKSTTTNEPETPTDPASPPVEPSKAVPVDIPANEPYPTGGANPVQGVPHNEPPKDGAA